MRLLAVALLLAVSAAACGGDSDTPTAPSANVPFSTVDLRVGTGAEANTGRVFTANYAGYFYSETAPENKGTQFGGGTLTDAVVGVNLIQGFSQGLIGMRVGGLRRVVVPPSLGYGAAGSPPSIPGNATLVFDLELLAVR